MKIFIEKACGYPTFIRIAFEKIEHKRNRKRKRKHHLRLRFQLRLRLVNFVTKGVPYEFLN